MAIVDGLTKGIERAPGGNAIMTTIDALADWARGQSLWEMPMGTACCAMELIAGSFSKFDFDRLGTFPRPDPRHDDVMVIAGTITKKMQPAVKRLYEQMPDPKYVIAMGNCTLTGGIFHYDSYSVVRGVDTFLPVDVYIAGCPPRPEALMDGILQLRALIQTHSLAEGRGYERDLALPGLDTPRAGTTDPCRGHLLPAASAGEPGKGDDTEPPDTSGGTPA